MTFLVITLSYMVNIYTAATNYLYTSSAAVHLTKFSPILPHSNKNAKKIVFVTLGGAPAPPASPWLRLCLKPGCQTSLRVATLLSSSSNLHSRKRTTCVTATQPTRHINCIKEIIIAYDTYVFYEIRLPNIKFDEYNQNYCF